MLSNKPYLMRAFYDWIVDSQCTPILVLDATNPRCQIPDDFVEGGEIVFNISPIAVRDLKITNRTVEFKASFGGIINVISAPIKAVLAIYAEENGEGLFFDGDEEGDEDSGEDNIVQLKAVDGKNPQSMMPPPSERTASKGKPFLKLIE